MATVHYILVFFWLMLLSMASSSPFRRGRRPATFNGAAILTNGCLSGINSIATLSSMNDSINYKRTSMRFGFDCSSPVYYHGWHARDGVSSRDIFKICPNRVAAQRTKTTLSALPTAKTDNECQMTNDALQMIKTAIHAVDPFAAVSNRLGIQHDRSNVDGLSESKLVVEQDRAGRKLKYDLKNFNKIKIFSFGKASAAMAMAVAKIISGVYPNHLEGVVIIKDDHATSEEIQSMNENYNIVVRPASHPIPDARSVSGANEILQSAFDSDEKTLVIACISGGGSALFCSPRDPLTLEDLMATNSALLASGMPIEKMNVIRKRLENGKGGRLASAAYPATVLTLV
ncbi:hypothetical protein ACHAXS_008237 [Conticribra weissflogii]